MRRVVLIVLLGGLLGTAPLAAQETAAPVRPATEGQLFPAMAPADVPEGFHWQPVWGLVGLRVINGPRIAPNGQKYHPSFSIDQNLNFSLWPSQGLYLFGDFRFWGQRPEHGVTNGRDAGLRFSTRESDSAAGP